MKGRKPSYITFTCEECGKSVTVTRSEFYHNGPNGRKFCSKACRAHHAIQRRAEIMADDGRPGFVPRRYDCGSVRLAKPRACGKCGRMFRTVPKDVDPRWARFCIPCRCDEHYCEDGEDARWLTRGSSDHGIVLNYFYGEA